MRQVEPRHRNRIEAFHEKAKEEKL